MGRLTTLEGYRNGRPSLHLEEALRVLILEPDPCIAQALQATLESLGITVCGIAADQEDVLALARSTKPDLTLIDSGRSGSDGGIGIARRLHALEGVRSVFLASRADQQTLSQIGASYPLGIVHRPYSAAQLKTALDLAAKRLRCRTAQPVEVAS